jgi:hypothetical protein
VPVLDAVAFAVNYYVQISDNVRTIIGKVTAKVGSTLTVQTIAIIAGAAGNTMSFGAVVSFGGPPGTNGTNGSAGSTGPTGATGATGGTGATGVGFPNLTEVNDGSVTGATTIDWSLGIRHKITTTGTAAITMTNPQAGHTHLLKVVGTGQAVTFATTVNWAGKTLPDVTAGTGTRTSIFSVYYDGAAYWGSALVNCG